jgi:hypothetical protein
MNPSRTRKRQLIQYISLPLAEILLNLIAQMPTHYKALRDKLPPLALAFSSSAESYEMLHQTEIVSSGIEKPITTT